MTSRIARESNTVAEMIYMYCRANHGAGGLCHECLALLNYAQARLGKCPFREGKPTCAKCPAHCYGSEMREKIRKVMRYSGPRMIYRHPVMAIQHLMDGRRKTPLRVPGAKTVST